MGRGLRINRSGKRKREKQSVAASMSKLPENVLDDILSRLPVKDLLRFRCVSKRWCALIDSPMFTKLRSLETRTNFSLIFRNRTKLYSVDLDMLDGVLNLGSTAPHIDIVEVDNPIKSEVWWTSVEGCCNGLICLHRFMNEAIALLNPSTQEYRILPPVPPHNGGFPAHGLVHDPVGDDYKVVRIVDVPDSDSDSDSDSPQVMVYGLRSNTWRRVCESFDYDLYLPERGESSERNPGVLINGALHWLAHRDWTDLFDIVVAFDPVDEKYWELEVPSVSSVCYGTLGVLDGCLCILYTINEENAIELWVMNDYMVESSWTKLFRVTMPYVSHGYTMPCPRVLTYSKSSREVILLHMLGNLFWYDLKEKRIVNLGISLVDADVNAKSLVKLHHYQLIGIL